MSGALSIGRLRADCAVVGGQAALPGFRDATTRTLGNHLPQAIRGACGPWFDRDDASVWIVRRLELPVLLTAQTAAESLATSLADSLGRTLGAALVGDGDGINTIRFESPVAYLAQFLLDAAAGAVATRWYYAPFSGLRALPPSAAIRTALLASPERGQAALAALDDRDLARVCEALTEADEQRVLDGLAASCDGPEANTDETFSAAWTGCERAREAGRDRCRSLHALIRSPGLVRSAQLVAAVRRLLVLVKTTRVSDTRAADPAAGLVLGESARPNWNGIPADTTSAVAASQATGPAPGPAHFTWFGGLFLLLPALDALPWGEWTAGWPTPPGASPAAVLRWQTAALCTGRERQGAAIDDPLLRALLGIPAELTDREVGRWLRRVRPRRRQALRHAIGFAHPDRPQPRAWFGTSSGRGIGPPWVALLARVACVVLRRFAARLPGFAKSTPAHLWRNVLGFDASVEYEPERVVVRCGRPPLQLLLSITGMTRGTLAGQDPIGRSIFLFPRE